MPEMTQGTPGTMAGVSAGLVGADRKFDPGDSWGRMTGPHLGTDSSGRPNPNGRITGSWTVNGTPGPTPNVPSPPTAYDLKRLNGQNEFVDNTPDNSPIPAPFKLLNETDHQSAEKVTWGTMGGHAAPMPKATPPPVHNVPPRVQWQQISPQQLYNPQQTYRGLSRADLQPSNKIQYARR